MKSGRLGVILAQKLLPVHVNHERRLADEVDASMKSLARFVRACRIFQAAQHVFCPVL